MSASHESIDIAAVVARSPWFEGLTATAIADVAAAARVRAVPRSGFVYNAGMHTTDVYCLLSGRVRLGMTSTLGQEFAVTDLEPEAWFGEQSLTSDNVRVLDAFALEDIAVLTIPRQVVQALGDRYPALYRNLFSLHVDNTRKIYELLGGMLFYPLRSRLAGRLLQLVDLHGQEADGGVYLHVKLSQNDFARLSLGSRQRVNKIFREWFDQGVIVMQGQHYFIKDIDALRREIDLTAQ